ncbi:MAG: isoprenylcysteine carboxylmethyltransferase family protein, partial [Bdellovibrionales bacterium]|nr:isoprenylcysteine carboxylmethyltransferase family protein [Bdellovibrionales bacterium]
VIAQIQMSNSWRIGIDEKNKTELMTFGLFNFSRNPIFTGMVVSQLGFFLYQSTPLNLSLLIIAFFLISIQIRLEEEFLLKQHGDIYLVFKNKVPRWLF